MQFSVTAGGTRPLYYQWRFNGTNLPGAASSSLTITNVQLQHVGTYSVEITNSAGSILSSDAILTVTVPPATVLVPNTNTPSGWPVTVPILLSANGNENAVSFSLSFGTQSRNQLLNFMDVALGKDAQGASIIINTNQLSLGLVGVGIALPAGAVFSAGTQEVALVKFDTVVVTFEQLASTTIAFGDNPLPRQLTDASAASLPVIFTYGRVTLIASDIEGDTMPRPGGNRGLSLNDWVQAGRFAAGLDIPAPGGEFQRMDCAPRSTRGDGLIKVTDWVQAGRYFAKLDPLTAVGGPTNAATLWKSEAKGPEGDPGTRRVQVGDAVTTQGIVFEIPVFLEAEGNENALGFTLSFDPARLEYLSAASGVDAKNATLDLNSTVAGKVGLVMALPTGAVFPAGMREIARVSFRTTATAPATMVIGYADSPVIRAVSDPVAIELPSDYLPGAVSVQLPPALGIAVAGDQAVLTWPFWAGDFKLQTAGDPDLPPNSWTNVVSSPTTNGNTISIRIPIAGEAQFFRLQHP